MYRKIPRVQVCLPEDVLNIYANAASVLGVSASKLAAEVLSQAVPSVQAMASVVLVAKQRQKVCAMAAVSKIIQSKAECA